MDRKLPSGSLLRLQERESAGPVCVRPSATSTAYGPAPSVQNPSDRGRGQCAER